MTSGGGRRFDNQVAWARFYLTRAGFLDASRYGVWSLTEAGQSRIGMNLEQSLELFKSLQSTFAKNRKGKPPEINDETVAPESELELGDSQGDFRQAYLARLQALSSEGFERFARRLLLESGFQEVVVTGRSRDGGIDGIGRLQVNPMVSTKVVFQCKRYIHNVRVEQVRDFRGAMSGRSENGIIITTGGFTSDAREEARRDGVVPIELVDSARLIELCEQLGLGLVPVTTYELDDQFFSNFK